MFKKDLTPYERFESAQKKVDKLCDKRDELDKYHRWEFYYAEKRKQLTRQIAAAIHERDVAEEAIKNPPPVPAYINTSRNFEFSIGSNNKASLEAHYHKGDDGTATITSDSTKKHCPQKKQTASEKKLGFKSIAKIVGLSFLLVIVIIGLIGIFIAKR